MAPPLKPFDAKMAKAWVGGDMKKYFKVKPRPKPAKPRGCPKKRMKAARALSPPGTNIPAELIMPFPAPVATFNIAEGAAPVIAGFKATENVPKKTKRGASREVGESHL
jgi:hypothetical protein